MKGNQMPYIINETFQIQDFTLCVCRIFYSWFSGNLQSYLMQVNSPNDLNHECKQKKTIRNFVISTLNHNKTKKPSSIGDVFPRPINQTKSTYKGGDHTHIKFINS